MVALAAACCLLTSCTSGTPAPAPVSSAHPAPTTPPPTGLDGLVATGGLGVELLLATSPPTVFDADSGVRGTLPGVPGGQRVVSVLRVGHTPVVLTAPTCSPAACAPAEVYVYLGLSPPRSLGKAVSAAPGEDGTSVWLIREDGPDLCRLEHVALTGTSFGPGTVASCHTLVRVETAHGLLITVGSGTAETVDVLIDPATGRTVQQSPRILAAAGDRLVLGGLTDLTILDLRGGARKPVALPVPSPNPDVLPSRDGDVAAVDFGTPSFPGTGTQTRDLWLLNLRDGSWQQTPSMPYSTENLKHSGLEWTQAGDLVIDDGVVAAWHPGEPAWRLGKAKLAAARQAAGVATS
ncbi:hypothetical protein [Amycolatopsis rubida]|uniref:Uncharacterized protein n=1 Tax=Amycolatopsis rubida TaxID=112413 RepID=A0A1I5F702_9PSEU|nr:hypothetical protein [Amycolatopsis rubida]SFO19555.1 hypothetical protein SAMN05421854_101976 [Amycolatopsis rubida]